MISNLRQLRVDECKVEDVVELPPAVFDDFTHSMLEDYDFIAERKDCMYNDSSYLSHCILVLCEGREDGVLVESEGSSYARYSGFLPNARTFMNGQIQKMADRIVHDGMPEQGSVLSEFTFEELSKQLNTQISWDSYIGQNLIDRLIDNGSVRNFSQTDDGISFEIIADEIEERQKPFTVRDLMRANLEDIHLLDTDVEHDLATIVELNEHTLTEEGVTAWSDVLNARVKRVSYRPWRIRSSRYQQGVQLSAYLHRGNENEISEEQNRKHHHPSYRKREEAHPVES